ncbi:MAG: acyl-CoA synthetase [Acidobacteriota bacterium]|nr:acyl-CoA synthetase [Acidobacteriota bacterium]
MTSASVRRLFSALAAFPEKEALVFAGRSWSFGDLDTASRRYAGGLSALGIGRGDRVAVFAESSVESIVALLAHYRLGAIHVPINTRYRADEAGHILRDSGARAVLVAAGSEQESVLRDVGAVDGLDTRVVIGGGSSDPGQVDFSSVLEGEPLRGDSAPADEDIAVIVYTSGTTGRSKGAALSYRALVENTGALTGAWRFSGEDRLALSLPLFHVHGLCLGIHGALLHGMTLLLSARFDASELVRLFAQQGATVFMGVPTMYVRLLEHLVHHPEAGEALSRARLFTSGSAPLPAADFAAFERATGYRILERYGMTETLFTLSNPYDGQRRSGTVGFPVGGCDVRIVDDAGSDVREDETGEILVRGNGMMTAYWGRPEETRAAFRDGWFATGDVAARDGDGYVRILGRKSVDVIKSGGFKISAREIEEVLTSHPPILEAAVVGVPDRVWGERIVAVVVLRDEREHEEVKEGLRALCARSLADYKRPKEIRILRELPRNAMGKVQKNRIAEQLGSDS